MCAWSRYGWCLMGVWGRGGVLLSPVKFTRAWRPGNRCRYGWSLISWELNMEGISTWASFTSWPIDLRSHRVSCWGGALMSR